VILAAGRSTRMGGGKLLLPLGPTSVIERLAGSVSRAEIEEIVVVTGHEPERLAPLLAHLPVRPVHNPGYDTGMFSSVRTGVAALSSDVEALFILPADYPLVRTGVLDRLIDAFRGATALDDRRARLTALHDRRAHPAAPGLLHPTCCGRRGHPPLVSGRYRDALIETGEHDLRSFFRRHLQDEVEVEVHDMTILMDMDTKEDYGRMGRFAALLDAVAAGPGCGRDRAVRARRSVGGPIDRGRPLSSCPPRGPR